MAARQRHLKIISRKGGYLDFLLVWIIFTEMFYLGGRLIGALLL
jgi:hypothetical protein